MEKFGPSMKRVNYNYNPGEVLVHNLLSLRNSFMPSVEEILKAADEESCDAIVLGTHGKGF